ncbi:MAG TPA: MFS transporter [Terriglobia bacterium]|nr:MFS transporter [Terriglobia bacterium]
MAADTETHPIPSAETPTSARIPIHMRYFSLLRGNRNFRQVWTAQLVSELGDWFYSVAVYDLLFQMTRSGKAVGFAIIMQTLPWFLMTPLAGALVDRFSRRRLMMLCDVVQGFVVLGLLLVRGPADVWLVYTLLGLEVIFASIFEPARNALLPNITRPEELLAANALSSATWSFTLMTGAALGGLITALLGRPAAFVLNSISFFASATFLSRVRCVETHVDPDSNEFGEVRPKPNAIAEGARYLKEKPKVVVLILAKTGVGFLGGGLLLLVIFGERIFPIAGHGALAVGLLYAARGLGAAIGPMVGDFFIHEQESRMWRSVSLSFFLIGVAYIAFSHAPNLPIALLAIMIAHMGGSNIWVVTTTLLQVHTEDRFRGRIFALDMGMLMLAVSTSNYILGIGLDTWKYTAPQSAIGLGLALIIPGLLWLPVQAKWAGKKVKRSADTVNG